MDSLLANYASSDEDEQQSNRNPKPSSSSSSSSSLPSLSSLPPPKSHQPKRVVQLKPIINPYALKDDDEEEDEDQRDLKRRKDSQSLPSGSSSTKSLLSMMPAPKNSLGLASSARRAIVHTAHSQEPNSDAAEEPHAESFDSNASNYGYEHSVGAQFGAAYDGGDGGGGYYGAPAGQELGGGDIGIGIGEIGVGIREIGRKGKAEIVEVKQDELMKNRPRQDQATLTGIAFGPSYQPASSKGKPSKLHKRKHQIGSLYFDMKQKEMELSERRAKGFLTKSQTQAKYGW